jgi:Eukaryotic aspartyl protease
VQLDNTQLRSTMVLIRINPHICVLKLTIIGFLVINSFVLCLDTYFESEPSSERLEGHQQVLHGPDIEISPSSVGNVLEVPLQRRFIEHRGRFYFLKILIGSPAQSLEMFVDTGSTDTWVYSTNHSTKRSSNSHFHCCKSTQEFSPSDILCY